MAKDEGTLSKLNNEAMSELRRKMQESSSGKTTKKAAKSSLTKKAKTPAPDPTVPAHVFEKESNPEREPVASVVETFFSDAGGNIEPGVGYDGLVLNHRNYVNTPTDDNGRPLVEFRFGSFRAGCPERNSRGAFVEAKVNADRELDPHGKPVTVGNMRLLVRKTEHGDARRDQLASVIQRHSKRNKVEAVREEADNLGLTENVSIKEETKNIGGVGG